MKAAASVWAVDRKRLVLTCSVRVYSTQTPFSNTLASRRWSRKRWFGRGSDVREWNFGIAGGAPPRRRWPFLADFRQRAEPAGRNRCRQYLNVQHFKPCRRQ